MDLEKELDHRMGRFGFNPCGEIIGKDFFCSLGEVHLINLDPYNLEEQKKAFIAASLTATGLLKLKFTNQKFQESRELDPIVGVSFTGLFDFFVNAFGVDWLRWWEAGRKANWDCGSRDYLEYIYSCMRSLFNIAEDDALWDKDDGEIFKELERRYLSYWKNCVKEAVTDYCKRNSLKIPNRYTTVQPSGSKSLLTGSSPGWHPPKAIRYIRRITFRRDDPVAQACRAFGYNVVPSQSCKHKNGDLLNNPDHPNATEWLIEIPIAVPWADIADAANVDPNQFTIEAQFDFCMQVQQHYVTHNTSATLEFRENEIDTLTDLIDDAIKNKQGWVSSALMARFDSFQSHPRLPFEPVTKEEYERLLAKFESRNQAIVDLGYTFENLLQFYITEDTQQVEAGPAGCDSDKCLIGGS